MKSKVSRLCGERRSREEAIRALGELGADMEVISKWKGTTAQFRAILDGVGKHREIYPANSKPSCKEEQS